MLCASIGILIIASLVIQHQTTDMALYQIRCCLFKKVPSCEKENVYYRAVKDIGGIWQLKPKPGILMIARPDVRPNSGYGRAALYT